MVALLLLRCCWATVHRFVALSFSLSLSLSLSIVFQHFKVGDGDGWVVVVVGGGVVVVVSWLREGGGGCWLASSCGCDLYARHRQDLLRCVLILRGVRFVRRGGRARLLRVAHLQRVDDRRRMGRIVRIGCRADVLLLRER